MSIYTESKICQPGKPKATSVTHNRIDLEWSKPDYGSEHVEMYIVYCRLSTSSNWTTIPDSEECELVERISIGKDYLKPNEKYVFKVKPFCQRCAVRDSEESEPIETVPVCQPGRPRAVSVTHNSIKLEWPKPMFGRDKVSQYIVQYRKHSEEKWSKKKLTQSVQEMFLVTNLDVDVQYVFKVTPILSNSNMNPVTSEASDPIETARTCQTGKPKPSVVTHNSITIVWDKPEYGSDYVNFYYVYYYNPNCDKAKNVQQQNMKCTEQTNFTLDNLEVGAKFVFWVKPDCTHKAIKSVDSEESEEIETKPACKPGKPIVVSKTHNSVALKWDKPEYYHENVELYTISKSSSDSKFLEWSRQSRTKGRQENIKVQGLSTGQKYMFIVEAVCSGEANVVESDPSNIIETLVTSKPGKPACNNIQHDKVDISWTHPEHGRENVVSYTVVTLQEDELSSITKLSEMHISSDKTLNATITGLTSNSKYLFTVIPVCQTGEGMESDTSVPVETLPACQTSKPIVFNVTHNGVTLTWEKPKYRSDQIKHYQILYHSPNLPQEAKTGEKTFEIKSKETSAVLSSLEMDKEYVFKILPVCMQPDVIVFESQESEIIKTTAASPPHGLKAGKITHNSIQMKWSKPKQKLSTSKISSYRLSYRGEGDPTNVWKSIHTETKKEEKITVNELSSGTKYTFKVCATYASKAQVGTESNVVIVETTHSCKPGVVQATQVSHNAVTLKWTKPKDFADTVKYYTVEYCVPSENAQWNSINTDGCQNELTIENLNINTSYVFKVIPFNSRKVITQSTGSEAITTKSSSKPTGLKQRNAFHDKIELEWEMPKHGSQNILSFVIFYRPVQESNWQQQESKGSLTKMTIHDLSLKTNYVFKVLPKSVNGEGCESDVSSPIQTRATSPPGKPQIDEVRHNSVTLHWNHPEYGSKNVNEYTVYASSSEEYADIITAVTDQDYVTVGGLTANTKYTFFVVPSCENGTGSQSEYSDRIETKLSCKPGIPKAFSVTHERVQLHWSRPEFQSDSIEQYSVFYWNVDNPHNTTEYMTDDLQENVIIPDLYHNTKYKFKVTPLCTDLEVGTESSLSATIQTKATSKPGVPVVVEVTHDSVKLKWEKPEIGYDFIDSYIVSCRLEKSKKWISETTNDLQQTIKFCGLSLNESYVFKVKSQCRHAEGTESDESETITTSATSPPGKPFVSTVTHESLTLHWSPPDKGCHNVSGYLVLYHLQNHDYTNIKWNTQRSTVSSLTITGLEINTKYIFKVKSECESGLIGLESESTDWISTKATSKPSIPQVLSSTNNSVQLKWNKPELGSQNIESYIVLYNKIDPTDKSALTANYTSINSMQYDTKSSRNCATVTGLTEKTQYVFSVLPVCFNGSGSNSDDSKSYWTKATSPPGIPIATRITHNTILLRWTKPEYGSENVDHYVISCNPEQNQKQSWNIETKQCGQYVAVTDLSPGSSYTFTVRSECTGIDKGMESDSSQPIVTKLTSPPGKPTAVEITHKSISIEWTKPEIGNKLVKNYLVYYRQSHVDSSSARWILSTATILSGCNKAEVSQLTPQTMYEFKVKAMLGENDSGCESESSDVITTKPSSKPGKPFATKVGYDTMTLKWDEPEFGSECVEIYTVSFYATNQPEKKRKQQGTNDCSLQVSKLVPNTEYLFEVYPILNTDTGECGVCSDLSEPIKTAITSKPGKPMIMTEMVTHNSVQVNWIEPLYGKDNVESYSILYQLQNQSDWTSSQTAQCEETQATVSGLKPGEKYVFKVHTVCIEGEGSESEISDVVETKATSLPAQPIPCPGEVTYKSIKLMWSNPRIISSKIVSYFVFYQKVSANFPNWTQKSTSGHQTTIILDNLDMNTKYNIYVQPKCQTGTGRSSKIQTIETKATSKPENLAVTSVLHDTIHLKWTKPKYGIKNITSYMLLYQLIDKQQPSLKWISVQLQYGRNDESAIISGLTPGTRHVFKLLPQCTGNSGTESDPTDIVETKITSMPGKPRPYNICHNSLNLRWTKPKHGGNLVTSYVIHHKEISVHGEREIWKQQDCAGNNSDTVVGGLTAGKRYVFKLEAKCDGYSTSVGAMSEISDPVETKSTSPPGKPKISGDITHESIGVSWTPPRYGADNVNGYTIHYRARDDPSENWKTCTVNSATTLSHTVNNLQSKTNYIFKVSSTCTTGIGAESECSESIETMPSCKPGKPEAVDITHESINLEWSVPEYGSVISYIVYYQKENQPGGVWQEKCSSENHIQLENLTHKTEYYVLVYPQIEPGSGMGIEHSEIIVVKTKHIPLAQRMKEKSQLIERGQGGHPDIYQVPIRTVRTDRKHMIRKFFVGEADVRPNCTFNNISSGKVIMIVGATGTGKTTLINGLVNYFLGVKWEHTYRFKMIVEKESESDQTKSQTKWITAYTIQQMEECPVNYPLTIIDTPGFGDTEGIERDQRLVEQIKAFFCTEGDGGIDQINVIGFATQSGLARLTSLQKYIFHSVMSIFGKDMKDNICMLVTFADGAVPPVLKAVQTANVPYSKHYLFNNSALFAAASEVRGGKMFWDMGTTSFKQFFDELAQVPPKSLLLTKEVLEEREHLEVCVESLQHQVRDGLAKIDALNQVEYEIKKHEAQLCENKAFKFTIKVPKQRRIDLDPGIYVTNCLTCNRTCHYPCYIPKDEDKHSCAAMGDNRHTPEAKCMICPGKCHWRFHVNNPYRFETYQEDEERTSEDLKKRYCDAKDGKLKVGNMIAKLNQELNEWYKDVLKTIQQTHQILKRLHEIALKPNPLTEVGYIDLLIQSEQDIAEPGYLQRIESLKKIKDKAKLLSLPHAKLSSSTDGEKPWESFLTEMKSDDKNSSC